MREIKFRAWDKVQKEMHDWDYLKGWTFRQIESQKDVVELMQYTGLKDKNDKEIYESDKIKDLDGNVGVVEFDDGSFIIRHENGTSDFIARVNHFEIVGNVYE